MGSDTPGPVLGVLSTPYESKQCGSRKSYPYGEEVEKERPPDLPIRAEMEWIKNHHCGDAVTKGDTGKYHHSLPLINCTGRLQTWGY